MTTFEQIKALEGTRIGQYEVRSFIGQGGMAAVFSAWHPGLGQEIVLKVLLPAYAQNAQVVKRFQREAHEASKLNHPNIIRIFDAGAADGQYYIAMEYVRGGSVKDLMDRQTGKPLDLDTALSIISQIASGLDYAHRAGVIHRDVKPSNILLNEEGRAILTDFGIAFAVEGTRLTSDMMAVGTPDYMSPEQGQGQAVDARSDIYSLGIVLYEMLSGRPPFRADTPWAVIHKHIYEPLPPLRQINPKVPAAVVQVIEGAMAKNPGERYPTAGALARALRQASAAKPVASVARTAAKPSLLWVALAVVGALVLVGGIVLASVLLGGPPPTPTEVAQASTTAVPIVDGTLPPSPSPTTPTAAPTPTSGPNEPTDTPPPPTETPVAASDTPSPAPTTTPSATSTETPEPTPTPIPTETQPPAPTAVPTIAPGRYVIGRSGSTSLYGTWTFSVDAVEVQPNGQMKFEVSWLWERGPDVQEDLALTKHSDADNHNMYITDNTRTTIHHTGVVGGAAAQDTKIESGKKVSGWFMFPKPPERAYEFAFHDDDQGIVIDGIRLR